MARSYQYSHGGRSSGVDRSRYRSALSSARRAGDSRPARAWARAATLCAWETTAGLPDSRAHSWAAVAAVAVAARSHSFRHYNSG
jgi:hypothetical protein